MAMKKKNSLPDMYSPEKKFSGFFCVYGLLEPKTKKELAKSASKKEQERADIYSLYSASRLRLSASVRLGNDSGKAGELSKSKSQK